MKKAMSLVLAFVMVLGLCACGASNVQETAAETTESTQPETTAAEETVTPEPTEAPHRGAYRSTHRTAL